jgi:NitT/TauT family transport system substrate-binding protein
MRRYRQIISVMFGLIAGCGQSGPGSNTDAPDQISEGAQTTSVELALNWYPEAEHGGYFAADQMGIFAENQLSVKIIPGSPGTSRVILQELAIGRVSFAISSADQVVEQRARGLPIVALFAPVQQSPRCIMVHQSSGIGALEELANVELAVSETRPFALWMKKKLHLNDVTFVPFNGLVGEFLSKPRFAQQAYVFSEPFIATEQGSDPVSLMLSDIGYNPYASVLVTSERMLAEKPEVVRKMQEAARAGWLAYLKDPDSTNKRIHAENSDMSLAALDYGATALKELCTADDHLPVGSMTVARWQQLIDQLVELEVIEANTVQAEDCFQAGVVESKTE